ncbi:MAG: TaqI-like C-terminal specificity domain-containing protein [Syntrophaceae bacterium]
MPVLERKQTVLKILEQLGGLDALKELFWTELNYERENAPLSMRGWPDSARKALVDDPILFASGGEENAFHVLYCRLASDSLQRNFERPIVNQLVREHPYCLFVFSDTTQSSWHFLNIKYDEKVEKRRIFRRITVRADSGLRTAAERLQMLDLVSIRKELSSIPALEIQKRHDDAFDVEKVTKDFYKELANWYFWALRHVRFPKDAPKEADGHEHIGVIRMITRLIFCWFVKEKGLIPEELFNQRRLDKLLNGFTPDNNAGKDSVFYKAILQNLFFATLNTEMDKRGWARGEQNFMAHSLYRYRDLFQEPDAVLAMFKNIPFLNGGLFECLDKDLGEGARPRYVRIDGFSRRPDSQPVVPDFLFFGSEREEDLSADYGDKKFRKVRVRGLIHTLQRYRFTIEENTPIEQEVALDPELSGKVFENLLAVYNPETGATARKQTGSFYTPREIVDYMVDEALIAFMNGSLITENAEATEKKLRRLASWEESDHDFDDRETEMLIAAIDKLKALDPAVGSGAFPMGILHKLVFILGKLDPRNEQWKQRQIRRVRDAVAAAEKIEDAAIRERTVRELEQQIVGIEEAFERNELDYGRKLYLIENCLYGVDIQSIAVQIAKMRFFISLIVDQRVDPDAANLGVRPLPNLETKFVAANTLIGIEKPDQAMFRNPDIDAKEVELRKVREKHFNAKTPASKTKYRELDKRLRSEVAELLKRDGWGDATAKRLAAWDPYDQNASAPFFDPEWMFGVREGFDVVIGNPPYVFGGNKGILREEKNVYKRLYVSGSQKINLFALFIERGSQLLQSRGTVTYILPNTLLRVTSYSNTRQFILENLKVREIVDLDVGVFDGVTASTVVISLEKACPGPLSVVRVKRGYEDTVSSRILQREWKGKGCVFDIFSSARDRTLIGKLTQDTMPLGELCSRIRFGVVISGNFGDVVSDKKPNSKWKPFLEGDEIGPFSTKYRGRFLLYDKGLLHRSRTTDIFETRKIMIQRITGGDTPLQATLDEEHFYNKESIINLILGSDEVSYEYILALLNSRLANWFYKQRFTNSSKLTVNLSKEYLGQIPVKTMDKRRQESIAKLVTRILAVKQANPAADTSALEREIDRIVYELYELTDEEIAIVEGASFAK